MCVSYARAWWTLLALGMFLTGCFVAVLSQSFWTILAAIWNWEILFVLVTFLIYEKEDDE
ncbi:MAG: hypothetical protein COW88_03605 [Candidatus Lloydbacteria bacterium CG22_combo_CG10-13_8_21_14_all_47_15]|uniref:Uncharacterized protein n=1 Tax=Candidatus Lloydbacteria bacterium CG22_combo_CG10-13_8_21_14_all_47_15 TaxID=1974635 RepID=A0A2H0CT86_9BACT|nr:MAG: hypothetical protein COW88_03605 [Candidatus Lloydbacteria bacterium CG22_combo_CG10-13_8_21_14_all_47_15]